MEVSLIDILNAREERVRVQQQLLKEHSCPVISFTMNIAGPIKTTPLIQRGFQAGLDSLLAQLPASQLRKQLVHTAPTGYTAMFAVNMEATKLKEICVRLEESSSLGRLFDMDVLTGDGTKLERPHQRGCLVCGAPGRACASRRLHSVAELQDVTQRILREHFAVADQEHIAQLAVQSLIDEVNTTPKPGLVDLRNSGSHQDMTPRHFYASAEALRPYFCECVQIGQQTAAFPAYETFALLRQAGIQAEKAMYQATGGVNTHKGAIYTMGVLCGSLGRLWTAENPIVNTASIIATAAAMVSESTRTDFQNATGITAGERCYLQYGIGGIRQEVANGLPSVCDVALPCYEKYLEDGLSQNDAGAFTLLHLISKVEDTNLYHRGGPNGAKWAAQAAADLLKKTSVTDILPLDNAFIQKNLSPGGCADLLAITYFLHALK